MDRSERFYKIDQLIHERTLVSFQTLLDELEVSRATLRRDLQYLRERFGAPIIYDHFAGGYRFDRSIPVLGGQYELPGLWFNSQEIHALLTMQHLLASLDPGGLLAPHIQPLMSRLNTLLGTADTSAEEIRRRVLIVGLGKRAMKLAHFEKVGSALIRRQRLFIRYYSRGRGEMTEREVSPQRIVYYRENWYLDAWCHQRRALRNFAIDAIAYLDILEKPTRDISAKAVDDELGNGYGIFEGAAIHTAKLRFSPERARWVAHESWHPNQIGQFDADGYYLLEFPYADPRELLMDILKFGADCEVLGPAILRRQVREQLAAASTLYAPRPRRPPVEQSNPADATVPGNSPTA